MTRPELWVCHLGVDYLEALELQEGIRAARQRDEVADVLLTLQHPPVYTRGRRSGPGELPMGEDFYRAQGIEVIQTDRGGKVTYHGPGQLVGYPIVRVDDVVACMCASSSWRWWRRWRRRECRPGRGRTRARTTPASGCRTARSRRSACTLSRQVTTHGFAVNVENDLQPFQWVVACGLDGVRMTSLIQETGRDVGQMHCFRKRAAWQVAEALGRRQRLVSLAQLESGCSSGHPRRISEAINVATCSGRLVTGSRSCGHVHPATISR